MVRYLSLLVFAAAAFVLAGEGSASAANYYVDAACSVAGNGTVDGCATAAGGGGAFRDPQACINVARGGDTCFIKNGTYITTNQGSGDPSVMGGYHFSFSGSSTAPITFRNYPGHSPILSNCSLTATDYSSCARPTISNDNGSYITITGLRIRGGIWMYGNNMAVGAGTRGLIIEGNEIWQGWGEVGDGNWAAVFLQNFTGALVRYNYVHDVSTLGGGGQQSSGGCFKLYQNTDSIVEYNTCRTVTIPESQAGGIDDKAQAVRNIHRFNWIENVRNCVRVNNQLNSTGVRIYGNVCIASGGSDQAIKPLVNINGIDFYNNTLIGFNVGMYDPGNGNSNIRVYNNIFANVALNNLEIYGGSAYVMDYNAHTPGRPYRTPQGWYTSLAAMRSGNGWGAHSIEGVCQFVSSNDLHLAAGSACSLAGRTGGTTSGSPVDLGAYGVASCVGYTCSGAQAPPPPPVGPSAPNNLRIVPSSE